jgi:glycosyltransferase involved in cell wall biosynthesis
MTTTAVIIPALNEAGNIRRLVAEVQGMAPGRVIVVNNGSTDATAEEAQAADAQVVADEADLVLGSRWRGAIAPGAMPFQQRFGNWLAARLMNTFYGLSVTDLGPYRAIRRSLLARLDMREMTFGWPTEMMVKAARQGARIVEVPVSYHPRRAGRSKVSGTLRGTLLAAWFILGVTLRYAWPGGESR